MITDEFVLATVGKIQNTWDCCITLPGFGVQMSMVRSNTYLKIPADQEGLETGSPATVILTVRKSPAEQGVLISGNHDPTIDYLVNLVREPRIFIASSYGGSVGGLLTLK